MKRILLTAVFALVVCARLEAAGREPLPAFSPDDRVLILAPHPDDEIIGTAGVIQLALKAGARVHVVCYTNGDNNEFSFIVYEKRLTFRKGEFLHMGQVRHDETIAGLDVLGVRREDIRFMGYPDFGTMDILTKYWETDRPYRSMLTRVTKVSYPDALSVGAPFVGESILRDIKTVLQAFRPTRIFVSHPADTNRDHQALYVFLRVALWDLGSAIPAPQVFAYLIHVIGWPVPRGSHPELSLSPPADLAEFDWSVLPLEPEEMAGKAVAIALHKSQVTYNPPYLYTFARSNELFSDMPPLELKRSPPGSVDWRHIACQRVSRKQKNTVCVSTNALSYGLEGNTLLIRMELRTRLDKKLGTQFILLGYSRTVPFARMPKLAVTIGVMGMKIKNKRQVQFVPGAHYWFEGNTLMIALPLAGLGNPDYIFARVRRNLVRLPLNVSTWRILEIKP